MSDFPFVRSYVDLATARGPRLAVVWHMAEGGGTVGYLAKQNPNGVSVHFVVEYSGRIVQMLALYRMHTSIRATDIRRSDDPDGFYGATAAKAVLGDWWLNPNHSTIGVEVEGFAKDGPNAKQDAAIAELYIYLTDKYPGIRSLGHRDFADYKACPGKQFPWSAVGGHGPATTPETSDVKFIQASGLTPAPSGKLLRLPIGTPLYGFDGTQITKTASARDWPYVGLVDAHGGQYVILAGTGRVYDDGLTRPTLLVARTGTLVDAPPPPPVKYPVTVRVGEQTVEGAVTLP